jgi:hypothetical protein
MADVNVNALLAEQSGLSEQEVGVITSGVRVAGQLASAKNADELLNTVRAISGVATAAICKVGVASMLAAAGYTITGSTVAGPPGVVVGAATALAIIAGAGAIATACALGATSLIEGHVRANFGAYARSLVPETVRKYYAAKYGVEPSDELVGLMVHSTRNLYSLDTILARVSEDGFNPAMFTAVQKAAAEKKRKEAAELAQRRALLEKAKRDAAERARKDRMDRLARVYADLPAQKLEPMRKYILAGGKYTREDLVVFDAVVKKRGLKLTKDGDITWPALTALSLAVGGWIVWRAKRAR